MILSKNKARRVWRERTGWRPGQVAEDPALTLAKREARGGRPVYRQRTDGRTRPKPAVCVWRVYRNHPDESLRELAYQQAREAHEANGPCSSRVPKALGIHGELAEQWLARRKK